MISHNHRQLNVQQSRPSVVSLNAVVASLAVTEWTAWTTGLRVPASLLDYRGARGVVLTNADDPRPDCYYCQLWQASARTAACSAVTAP